MCVQENDGTYHRESPCHRKHVCSSSFSSFHTFAAQISCSELSLQEAVFGTVPFSLWLSWKSDVVERQESELENKKSSFEPPQSLDHDTLLLWTLIQTGSMKVMRVILRSLVSVVYVILTLLAGVSTVVLLIFQQRMFWWYLTTRWNYLGLLSSSSPRQLFVVIKLCKNAREVCSNNTHLWVSSSDESVKGENRSIAWEGICETLQRHRVRFEPGSKRLTAWIVIAESAFFFAWNYCLHTHNSTPKNGSAHWL